MFFKSIRWRLQMWYGLILLAVLAGFGVTAFDGSRRWLVLSSIYLSSILLLG